MSAPKLRNLTPKEFDDFKSQIGNFSDETKQELIKSSHRLDNGDAILNLNINLNRRDFLKKMGLSGFFLTGIVLNAQQAEAFFNILLMRKKASAAVLYVDDVFSTYLYTGSGAAQTITNGIDLAGKGGLIVIKGRNSPAGISGITGTDAPNQFTWQNTARGITKTLFSNTTNAETSFGGFVANTDISSTGFTLGYNGYNDYNYNSNTYASWTFRKAAKFFDVVTYTGDGTSNRLITHALGISPGMIVLKETNAVGNWKVFHRSMDAVSPEAYEMYLNTTAAKVNSGSSGIIDFSSTTFKVHGGGNTLNNTYVAYLFAHDTSAEGILQCGSYVGNGSTTGPIVTLGWEPQYVMIKRADGGPENWYMLDAMRGMPVGSTDNALYPNLSNAEAATTILSPTATGFQLDTTGSPNGNGATYIYLAIRRPNKPPTAGTQVYNAIAWTGTGAAATVTGVGFLPDLLFAQDRQGSGNPVWVDKLRGGDRYLYSSGTAAEATGFGLGFLQDGISLSTVYNTTGVSYINHFFRRTPGVFDVVCWINNNSVNQRVPHNLSAVPELIITKARDIDSVWYSYCSPATSQYQYLLLYSVNAVATNGAMLWGTAAPTTSDFGMNSTSSGTGLVTNTNVAYLFATLAGISKVGSYTGNGTSLTINCGFTTGARFILIKRTDLAGDWFVWDTACGIVAGNDPHLSLNTAVAEVTTDDSIDPDNAGFIVNQLAATNINVSAATYIFLAIA